MDVNRAQLDIGVAAPDAVEQPLSQKHPARMGKEMAQQAELGRTEIDRLTGAPYLVGGGIHFDVAVDQPVLEWRRPRRRNTAPTRATSSRGLNGLVM